MHLMLSPLDADDGPIVPPCFIRAKTRGRASTSQGYLVGNKHGAVKAQEGINRRIVRLIVSKDLNCCCCSNHL